MASSIQDMIKAALDSAVARGNLSERDRNSVVPVIGISGGTNASGARRYHLGQLNVYVDIAPSDVVDEVKLAGAESPFVIILVRGDAPIQLRAEISASTQAGFLNGDIAIQNLSQARVSWPNLFGWDIMHWGSTAWGCMPRTTGCLTLQCFNSLLCFATIAGCTGR